MIVFSHNHYYTYILQRQWSVGGISGLNRWVLFNDNQVKPMVDGWPEILSDCISTKAYPTVLVYEAWKPDSPRLENIAIPTD